VFPLVGAKLTSVNGKAVTVSLARAAAQTLAFLDDRTYPWNELMLRVADVNRNGVAGESMGVREIVPGAPSKSFVMMRLSDSTQGELMPAVCRQWSDEATRALGCWIQGLKADATGAVTNASDPIDYASCTFKPAEGRCSQNTATGFAAVEGIFSQSCGGAACHVDQMTPASGLDLSTGKAFTSLVGVASTEVPSMKRVAAGEPDQSYVMCKIEGTCAALVGERMPRGGTPLSDSEIAIIQGWITAGAPSQ
jgi:hypothetical protein